MNPPLYGGFDCSATNFTLSECARPSGLHTNVVDCGPGVVGVQCLGECRIISASRASGLTIGMAGGLG